MRGGKRCLTEAQDLEILRLWRDERATIVRLAAAYGVSDTSVKKSLARGGVTDDERAARFLEIIRGNVKKRQRRAGTPACSPFTPERWRSWLAEHNREMCAEEYHAVMRRRAGIEEMRRRCDGAYRTGQAVEELHCVVVPGLPGDAPGPDSGAGRVELQRRSPVADVDPIREYQERALRQ